MEIDPLLRQSHLCTELDETELEKVRAILSVRRLKKGEILFFEGDPAEGFFMVLQGGMRIYKASAEGKEYTLHRIGQGQIFAEAAIFSGKGFPANASAIEDSTLAFFPKERFLKLLQESPRISLKMIGGLSAFVREFNQMVADLSLKEVSARLASYLLRELRRAPGDTVILDVPKSELARRLGTVSETLSRNFKKLKSLNCIQVEGKKITILDSGRLVRIAEGEKV
ncbi:MAG: Crp/Fnr family transcriptional regulator [Planctomycetota bacterium]|jgi:CRP/FNR family transcriptional regulator